MYADPRGQSVPTSQLRPVRNDRPFCFPILDQAFAGKKQARGLLNFLFGVVNISQHSSGDYLWERRWQAMQRRLRFHGEETLPVEPHSKCVALLDEGQMSPGQDRSRVPLVRLRRWAARHLATACLSGFFVRHRIDCS